MKKIIAMLPLLLVLLAFTGCGKSVDVSKSILIKYEGFNRYGNIDSYKFVCEDDYTKEFLRAADKIKFSPSENLSNGDKITVNVNFSEDVIKAYKIEPKNTEFTVTVSGLEEGTEVDLFDGLKYRIVVEGTGFYSHTKIEFESDNEFLKENCDYIRLTHHYLPSMDDIKDGDKVTVCAVIHKKLLDDNNLIAVNKLMSEEEHFHTDLHLYSHYYNTDKIFATKEFTVTGIGEEPVWKSLLE